MSEMVERVARAILASHDYSKNDGKEGGFESLSPEWQEVLLANARAAIEAMREPTDDMKNCSEEVHWDYSCGQCGGLKEGWQMMIDEALK